MGGEKRWFFAPPCIKQYRRSDTCLSSCADTGRTSKQNRRGNRRRREDKAKKPIPPPPLTPICAVICIPIHTYSILVGGEICSIFWYVLFVGWRAGLPQSDMPQQPQKGKSELGLLLTLLGFLHSETATQTKEVSKTGRIRFPASFWKIRSECKL